MCSWHADEIDDDEPRCADCSQNLPSVRMMRRDKFGMLVPWDVCQECADQFSSPEEDAMETAEPVDYERDGGGEAA